MSKNILIQTPSEQMQVLSIVNTAKYGESIRFSNGMQIEYGMLTLAKGVSDGIYVFAQPFASRPNVQTTRNIENHNYSYEASIDTWGIHATDFSYRGRTEADSGLIVCFSFFAFGYWK